MANTGEMNWVYLTTVKNDIEYGIVAGLLETAGIPSVKKLKGIDNLLNIVIGIPIAGVDIMVPEDKHEEAVELINADAEDLPPEEESTEK